MILQRDDGEMLSLGTEMNLAEFITLAAFSAGVGTSLNVIRHRDGVNQVKSFHRGTKDFLVFASCVRRTSFNNCETSNAEF